MAAEIVIEKSSGTPKLMIKNGDGTYVFLEDNPSIIDVVGLDQVAVKMTVRLEDNCFPFKIG